MTMRLRQLALGALLLGWLTPCAVLAQTGAYTLFWDDFANGFTVDTPEAKWNHFRYGSFVADDGLVSGGLGWISIWPKGTNPRSGNPAFTKTVAPDPISGLPGALDHVKWLVYMNHTSSRGYPGFDAQWNYELSCKLGLSGQTYGVNRHPFGTNVTIPTEDVRLASFAMNTVDFESFMVFDFMFTNNRIYAIYERLPFGRATMGNYAAFTYAVPVKVYTPWDYYNTKIAYDRTAGVVKWLINGVEVFRVSNIGYRLADRQYMLIDHGGTEQAVSMNQLNCGMGMFTLLDGASPSGAGLVRLTNAPNFYFQPQVGTSQALWFADETSQQSSRLFGQGAEFDVEEIVVRSVKLY
jgi:hypothetical protein